MLKISHSILYIADIHGLELIQARGIKRNLSLAGFTKVCTIAESLRRFGHRVVVLSFGSPAEGTGMMFSAMQELIPQSQGDTLQVVYVGAVDIRILRDFYSGLCSLVKLPALIRQNSIDTVIVYNLSIANLLLAAASKILGCRIFFEYEDSVRISRSGQKFILIRWLTRAYEILARCFANGSFSASFELSQVFSADRRIIIPGILGQDIADISRDFSPDLWNPSRPLRLIYAGGLDSSKGLDRFLEALFGVSHSCKVEMRICGSGPQEQLVKELCRRSGGRVVFLGLVSRSELLNQLLWADVGINPHRSDLHDGGTWPFKVVEYLATCGTVFCSNTNGISRDLAAQLFPYEGNTETQIRSAFLLFLEQWPYLSVMAQSRRKWALEKYSLNTVGSELNNLLKKINFGDCYLDK
jgi:glycosyltransferase involved in cell wall biosynthesis